MSSSPPIKNKKNYVNLGLKYFIEKQETPTNDIMWIMIL
jgi:hypothetical protein